MSAVNGKQETKKGKIMDNRNLVVLKTDGTVEVTEMPVGADPFNHSKELIGCSVLEIVGLQSLGTETRLAMLVNENGYAEYGEDPKHINKAATFIYNTDIQHYILGDVVMTVEVLGEEGWDIVAMNKEFADELADRIKLMRQKWSAIPLPKKIEFPVPRIYEFNSDEDFKRAIETGDFEKYADKK